jgi:hypothetical protein
MRSKILWALIGLNLLLAIVFCSRWTAPNTAMAQPARLGEYVMIPGNVPGGSNAVVYILDSSNGLLSAMVWDGRQLAVMQPIDLSRVFGR